MSPATAFGSFMRGGDQIVEVDDPRCRTPCAYARSRRAGVCTTSARSWTGSKCVLTACGRVVTWLSASAVAKILTRMAFIGRARIGRAAMYELVKMNSKLHKAADLRRAACSPVRPKGRPRSFSARRCGRARELRKHGLPSRGDRRRVRLRGRGRPGAFDQDNRRSPSNRRTRSELRRAMVVPAVLPRPFCSRRPPGWLCRSCRPPQASRFMGILAKSRVQPRFTQRGS